MNPDEIPVKILREVEVGDTPMFPRGHAPGALPNGTRVRKSRDDPGDTHTIGDQATVLSSVGPHEGMFLYFVEWDDLPRIPVGIRSDKLSRA